MFIGERTRYHGGINGVGFDWLAALVMTLPKDFIYNEDSPDRAKIL